jgi:hypothetical protein
VVAEESAVVQRQRKTTGATGATGTTGVDFQLRAIG